MAAANKSVNRPGDQRFLRVSDNGHYFVKDGAPFFWMGDTMWPAFVLYTEEELDYYFRRRQQQGFTVEHVMIPFNGAFFLGFECSDRNLDGEPVFLNMNPETPNEKYFENVDKVISIAAKYDFIVVMLAMGGSGGTYVAHQKVFNKHNARVYGKWLGERYKDVPNIVWSNGFDIKPWEYEDVALAFAEGIREGDGGSHLMFYHPGGDYSSSHFHNEDWLDGNFIQTWASMHNIHKMVECDYFRKPAKPVVMVEGAYEAGTEYPNKPITAWHVRQQAYWSYLSGGFHTYGHNDIWRKSPEWKGAMEATGANQMTILKQIFTSIEWWKLVPDQTVMKRSRNTNVSARSADGDLAIIYVSSRDTIDVYMSKITASQMVKCEWINPQNGERKDAGEFPNTGTQSFTVPAQFEDAVLILKAK